MSKVFKSLNRLRDQLVLLAAEEPKALPKHRWDGEEADEYEVAAVLRIPLIEAAVRLRGKDALKDFEYKDVFANCASHSLTVGAGTTIQQRVGRFVQRRKRRPLRMRKVDDSSKGK